MDWPHAPVHRLSEAGTFMVTAGTLGKAHHFRGDDRLTILQDTLLQLADRYGWMLQAWAIFSNHYHFIANSPVEAASLPKFLGHLHAVTATAVNKLDGTPGRKVWFQYWDTKLTYEKSYFARLKYVHDNSVKHGLVTLPTDYQWCSASWFERTADPAFVKTVNSFKTDLLRIADDF